MKILNNPGRALEIVDNIGTAAGSKNPRMIAASAPDIIKFVHQGKGLYLGKIHWMYSLIILNKCIQFIIAMTWKN